MTLMSVFWDEGRAELEAFAREASVPSYEKSSPFNHSIKPAPDQMLRVTVGLSLKRARLESVYSALRGRDPKTGVDIPEKRDAQFALMRAGQNAALNLTNWHHFLSALTLAGYRGSKMISSETAIIYSYVLYLIGVRDYSIPREQMRQSISEFFFMSALTGRYTSSPETRFESDLGMLWELPDGAAFLARIRELCATTLTGDYWGITLPNQLATSASRSPSLFAYQAALISLDAAALYSKVKIAALADPAVSGPKSALEQHHLFPREFLKQHGVTDVKQINQIANFALIEWPKNLDIGFELALGLWSHTRQTILRAAARAILFLARPTAAMVGNALWRISRRAPRPYGQSDSGRLEAFDRRPAGSPCENTVRLGTHCNRRVGRRRIQVNVTDKPSYRSDRRQDAKCRS